MGEDIISPAVSAGGKYWAVPLYPNIITDCSERYNLSTYIEGTGAGARMLANLKRGIFKKRIYNEWDYDFCCYFAQLADSKKTKLLIKIIESLLEKYEPKELFKMAIDHITREKCSNIDLSLAAAFAFIRSFGSFGGNRTGFSLSKFNENIVEGKRYLKLTEYNNVLQGITITNTDCFNLVKAYNDNPQFFYFGDHPYWDTCVYGEERDWEDSRYIEFIKMVKHTKMKMMICDTKNPFYDTLVTDYGWSKYFIKDKHNDMGGEVMSEHIWVNFDFSLELLPKDAKRIA